MLQNGVALLGDVSKWAPMSYRRFDNFVESNTTVTADVIGNAGESVTISYTTGTTTNSTSAIVQNVRCDFPVTGGQCQPSNEHGDVDCVLQLTCVSTYCECSPKA